MVDLQCCVNFYCTAHSVTYIHTYIYIYLYTFFFIFFSIMVYHKTLNRVPCAYSRTLLFTHRIYNSLHLLTPRASCEAQLVKNPHAMQETWVRSLGWDDPLETGKATHSSILAWRFHGLDSPWGRKESDTTERLSQELTPTPSPSLLHLPLPWQLRVWSLVSVRRFLFRVVVVLFHR